jgi:phosphoglycolate phosphatase-like HAD superfamily hydrolase
VTDSIFFDFDGVIMDSMALKLDSYAHALRQFEFDRAALNQIMVEHTGTSRHRILRVMHQELAGTPISEENFDRALADFNREDAASVPRMPRVPGSLEFIERFHADRFTAIVTGTPHDVIQQTSEFHGLMAYFDVVRGTPDTKVQIVTEEMERHQIVRENALFIGDGKTDQLAAEACGIRFVGMAGEHSSFDPATAWRVVSDLNELVGDFR